MAEHELQMNETAYKRAHEILTLIITVFFLGWGAAESNIDDVDIFKW